MDCVRPDHLLLVFLAARHELSGMVLSSKEFEKDAFRAKKNTLARQCIPRECFSVGLLLSTQLEL
jgi:hypothetical protein